MTYDQPQEGVPPDDDRERKAPTIELKATEIGESSPDASADQPADEASKAGHRPGESVTQSDDPSGAPPARARSPFPFHGSRSAPGRVGGAIIAPAILLAIQSLFPDKNERALAERTGHIETALRAMPSQSSPLHRIEKQLMILQAGSPSWKPGRRRTSQQAPDAALQNRLSGIEGELKALGQSAGALGRRINEATTTAREARQGADARRRNAAPPHRSIPPRASERKQLASLTARLTTLDASQRAFQGELAKQAKAQPAMEQREWRLRLWR